MTEEAGKFAGQFYEVANKTLLMKWKLSATYSNKMLLHTHTHDWRTRKPVIFRATPQWFASVKAIKKIY